MPSKRDGKGRFQPKQAHGDALRRAVEHKIPKQAQPKVPKRGPGK